MIVVAIIGILAAVAIPAYQNYTKRAVDSQCLASTQNFTSKWSLYIADSALTTADATPKPLVADFNTSNCEITQPADDAAAAIAAKIIKGLNTKVNCTVASGKCEVSS